MILTDREIKNSLASGLITIEPQPVARAYAPTSVDLTLGATLMLFKPRTAGITEDIDPSSSGYDVRALLAKETSKLEIPEDGCVLKPGKLILGWTAESIALHLHGRVAARVEGKSGLARIGLGIHVTAPTIHAGFKAPSIQLEIINHAPLPIRLKAGMPICQLIIEQTLGMPDNTNQSQFAGQAPSAPSRSAAASATTPR